MKHRHARLRLRLGWTLAVAVCAPLFGQGGAEHAGWEDDRRLTRDPAASSMSINFQRNIAADRFGAVHLVWSDERAGNQEIYTKRSPDGGLNWSPAVRLTHSPGASRSPSIAAAGRRVHVVWFDDRAGAPKIFYLRSLDGGLTWESETVLVDAPTGAAHPSIAVWGSSIHVVYVDSRHGHSEVYYVRSVDGGSTWGEEFRLSDLPHNSWTPTVAVFRSYVYVAWTDTRHGEAQSHEEEYFKRSVDNGESWGEDVRLTRDPANSWAPSLAASGSNVWIVWFDERGERWQVYMRRSRDFGETWSKSRRLSSSSAAAVRPSVTVDGASLHVAWFDLRDGNAEIFVRASTDRGRRWGEEIRLTDSPGDSILVSVASSFAGVFAAWQDHRDGNPEIYFRRLPLQPVKVANGRIAFSRMLGDGPQIFTAASDGSGERQLTEPPGWSQYPAWSADGSRIAFTSTRTGVPEVWAMHADGSAQTRLTELPPGASFVPQFSPDGTRIAFASMRGSEHPEIWVMSADGSSPTRLTYTPRNQTGFNWSLLPSWSADSSKIVYASTRGGSSQIWMMFADGRGQKQKTAGLGPGFPDANAPSWSRDGSRIVFWSGYEGRFGELFTMAPDGQDRRQITVTQDPRNSDNPRWSPDGSQILFDTNRSDRVELWTVGADGSSPRYLLDASGPASWQPVFGSRGSSCRRAECAGRGR